jgi:uncharacterized protein
MTVLEHYPTTRRSFLTSAGLGLAAGVVTAGGVAADAPTRTALLGDGSEKTYLLVFDKGEEVRKGLLAFARKNRLVGGHFSAIGAVSQASLGFFDRQKKDYLRIAQNEQAEVLSLVGNLALKDDRPFFHAHVVLGLPDGSTRGGHLFEATVWPTLELVFTTATRPVRRKTDRETGLTLLDP